MKRVALLGNANSVHLARWAAGLAAQGWDVSVISLSEASTERYVDASVITVVGDSPLRYFSASGRVRAILQELQPTVIHAHYASGYGTLARRTGLPYVLSVWGSDVHEFPYRSRWHRRVFRANVMNASLVCATSSALASELLEIVPECKRVVLTPFGVDESLFTPEPRDSKNEREIVIGTVKSLRPVYGIDVLVRAFAHAVRLQRDMGGAAQGSLRLQIAGDGPDELHLRNLAGELGIATLVHFVGRLEHAEVPRFLRQLDIFAMLSRSESFGVSALEAAASGLPVIASDVGGIPEVVRNGVTGVLIRADDAQAAGQEIYRLATNRSERTRLGANGRRYVLERFTWNESLKSMESAYLSVTSDADGARRESSSASGRDIPPLRGGAK